MVVREPGVAALRCLTSVISWTVVLAQPPSQCSFCVLYHFPGVNLGWSAGSDLIRPMNSRIPSSSFLIVDPRYKSDLRSFLTATLSKPELVSQLNWDDYKRNFPSALVDRLLRNEDLSRRICFAS